MDSFLRIKNKNTIIFLISLGISAFMWLLIKLSKEYEIIVSIPIEYINKPSDKIMTRAGDSILKVNMVDNGFDLFGSRITGASNPLILDVGEFRVKRIGQNRTKHYALSNTFYDEMKSKFGASSKISIIKPDSLVLLFEKLASKKVKVYSDIKVDLAPQFQYSKPLSFNPEYVSIYGSAKQVAKIDSLFTVKKEFEHLENNINEELTLILPENIKSETSKVKLNIEIEKFTEASVEIPIQIQFSEGKQVKIFPNHVQIKFAISLDNYHQLKADQFIVIGKEDSLSVGKLNISLTKFPKNIRVIDYSPKMAEFIIIK